MGRLPQNERRLHPFHFQRGKSHVSHNRPATIHLTALRDGAKLATLKEVDCTDDTKVEWLVWNRTTLERRCAAWLQVMPDPVRLAAPGGDNGAVTILARAANE
ncbi:MAG: hypothetical protein ABI617_07510 [Sphingomicrobium sp.]